MRMHAQAFAGRNTQQLPKVTVRVVPVNLLLTTNFAHFTHFTHKGILGTNFGIDVEKGIKFSYQFVGTSAT